MSKGLSIMQKNNRKDSLTDQCLQYVITKRRNDGKTNYNDYQCYLGCIGCIPSNNYIFLMGARRFRKENKRKRSKKINKVRSYFKRKNDRRYNIKANKQFKRQSLIEFSYYRYTKASEHYYISK